MLTGTLRKIIYHDKQKEFIVGILTDETKICGTLPGATEGQKLTLWGEYTLHPKYGKQFAFTGYKTEDIYPYLASGLIKGLGETLAKKIIEKFPDPLNVIIKTPYKLAFINGISENKAMEISRSVKETLKYKQTAIDLAPCLLTPSQIIKIHHHFKDPNKILQNPYILTEIDGIGFIKADNIAQRLSIKPDSPKRIKTAAYYELNRSADKEGHVFLKDTELAIRTFKLLNEKIAPELIEENIRNLTCSREENNLYLPHLLQAENTIVEYFRNYKAPSGIDVSQYIDNYEISLAPSQKEAVKKAFQTGILVITGGPGTGKTETVKAITKIHQQISKEKIILTAPTGRASQRMSEMIGIKAQTIHRLIARDKIIEASMVIVDETSMVDIELFARLLKHLTPGARLIFVGDPDQLPPVGPGQVLQDIIDILPTVKLTQIFRQAEQSDIILNAHRVNKGDIDLRTGKDFYFIEKDTPEETQEVIKQYAQKYFNKKGNLNGLQVLTLMKKGSLGTEELNTILQNIASKGTTKYRLNDRVIQLQNNYPKNVFNGEIGKIISLNPVTVQYEDRKIEYQPYELDQISLAYAITVHKSQGSEFPVVIIPLSPQHFIMLNRKLLYTAITRARKQVILITNYKTLSITLRNLNFLERNSKLNEKMLDQFRHMCYS